MPVNAPAEYFKAEQKFQNAKGKDEKIVALEEMIRLLPKHHGSEAMHAQLKSRLAKLKKESTARGAGRGRTAAIAKEGEAQICLIGFANSGKSMLLSRLTDAKPAVAAHPYTTTKPEIGMMDYNGVKLQLVEIPATFENQHLSIARTADLLVLLARHEKEEKELRKILSDSFIRTKFIVANAFVEPADHIKEKVWHSLGMIIVYTKKTRTDGRAKKVELDPMALPVGSTVKQFCERIHKDFVRDFRFARILRRNRLIQAGLDYRLQDNDVVEVHTK